MEEIHLESSPGNTTVLSNYNTTIINLYEQNKDIINIITDKGFITATEQINKVLLYKVVKNLIKVIEKIPTLTGTDKKNILIEFIIYVIKKDIEIDSSVKNKILLMIQELLPDIIDMMVELWQEVNWRLIFRKFKKIINCCCKCNCCKKQNIENAYP